MTLPIDAMAAAFPPPLARFGRTLAFPRPDAVPCRELFAPDRLAGTALHHAATLRPEAPGVPDRRAALSLWSQYYLLALVPAVVAGTLAVGRQLPVAAEGMGAVLGADGLPACLCLPGGGARAPVACPVARLTPLLREHLQPLADALGRAGLTPPVFWGNVAHVLLWSLRVVGAPAGSCGTVRARLAMPCWGDGGCNPLAPVLAGDGRSRRVCCLRFRLPGLDVCPNCPRRTRGDAPVPKALPC